MSRKSRNKYLKNKKLSGTRPKPHESEKRKKEVKWKSMQSWNGKQF